MKYALMVLGTMAFVSACNQEKDKDPNGNVTVATASTATVVTGEGVKASAGKMSAVYFQLSDALVNWDTVAANKAALLLAEAADSIDFAGTADSTLITNIQNLAGTIHAESLALAGETDITAKRREFSMITDNLYPLLQAVQYNGQKIYYQVCPMAFNDSDSAFWISNKAEIMNPYLGTRHPKYASGMLHCGEVVDSINFVQ